MHQSLGVARILASFAHSNLRARSHTIYRENRVLRGSEIPVGLRARRAFQLHPEIVHRRRPADSAVGHRRRPRPSALAILSSAPRAVPIGAGPLAPGSCDGKVAY